MLQRSELFEVCLANTEGNLGVGSYSNLNEREQEGKQGVTCVVRRCRIELMCLIGMYAVLQVFVCCDMLRFESRATLRFFAEDTSGTSASQL